MTEIPDRQSTSQSFFPDFLSVIINNGYSFKDHVYKRLSGVLNRKEEAKRVVMSRDYKRTSENV